MRNGDSVGVGLLGLGVVGSGVVQALAQKAETIATQVGQPTGIRRILVRDLAKARARLRVV